MAFATPADLADLGRVAFVAPSERTRPRAIGCREVQGAPRNVDVFRLFSKLHLEAVDASHSASKNRWTTTPSGRCLWETKRERLSLARPVGLFSNKILHFQPIVIAHGEVKLP